MGNVNVHVVSYMSEIWDVVLPIFMWSLYSNGDVCGQTVWCGSEKES